MSFTPTPANATYLSTIPANGVLVVETNELLPASSTPFSTSSTISVTQGSSTTLSIAHGASSGAPQYVRFNPRSKSVTAASTLTLSSGTASGQVSIYGYLSSSNALLFYIVDTSGNTFTAGTGQTVVTGPNPAIPAGAVLLYTWLITSGSFAASGTNAQPSTDCWVDAIEISNTSSGAVTVTVTDGQGTVINLFDAVSVPANGIVTYAHGGGRYFDSGLFLTAGTASDLQVNVRLARLRQSPIIAGVNP